MANKSGRLSKESTQNPTTKNNRIFYFPPCKDSPASCVPVQGQGLAQSPAKDSPASKKPKNRLHGADNVKQTKKMKV